jgi:hypothetical protein
MAEFIRLPTCAFRLGSVSRSHGESSGSMALAIASCASSFASARLRVNEYACSKIAFRRSSSSLRSSSAASAPATLSAMRRTLPRSRRSGARCKRCVVCDSASPSRSSPSRHCSSASYRCLSATKSRRSPVNCSWSSRHSRRSSSPAWTRRPRVVGRPATAVHRRPMAVARRQTAVPRRVTTVPGQPTGVARRRTAMAWRPTGVCPH